MNIENARRLCAHLCCVLTIAAAAMAHPSVSPLAAADVAADGSFLMEVEPGAGRSQRVTVYSAAMDAPVELHVLPAADPSAPAPVLYLLNGAAGGTSGSSWYDQTDVARFLADQQVTVVIPLGGIGSYYTDWRSADPVLGRQRWATFLTRELPPVVDAAFHGTGANAIAGISMGATSVFQLALAVPGLYRAIGSYSGCVRTSDPLGQAMVTAVVTRWRGDVTNMWGPLTDPAWAANDPYLHAEELRGTTIYVSTGNGLAGPNDRLESPGIDGNPGKLIDRLAVGGMMEVISAGCTHALQKRFHELGIPATFELRPTGTHSWGYWQEDLHRSWTLFLPALSS